MGDEDSERKERIIPFHTPDLPQNQLTCISSRTNNIDINRHCRYGMWRGPDEEEGEGEEAEERVRRRDIIREDRELIKDGVW
jgi:hypothetical protein